MIKIVIGTEQNQYIPQKVLEFSIRQHTKSDLDIRCITQKEKRLGGTNFGFVRFQVPSIFNYEGKAIYLDADQIVLTDIQELNDTLDSQHLVGIVEDLVGYFGDKPVPKRKETSVMILNCNQLKDWQPKTMFDNVVPNDAELKPGQIHYRDFMWLKWLDEAKIQFIDSAWNHFNILQQDSKLVHFSHVASQPWKSPEHPLTEFWSQWLVATIESGFLDAKELKKAIQKRHVHPHFRKYCPRKKFFFF
jgi:lipopolysaccharide biosynthesis glycosyltransferase